MSREYPAGTLVCLKSSPDTPMTVIGTCSTFTYSDVMWLDGEGKAHHEALHDAALQKYEREDQ